METNKTEIFMGLRNKILNAKSEDLNIQLDSSASRRVWGIVTDIAMQTGSVCLVAMIDGSASLYFSTGGAIQSGVGDDKIRDAATNYARQCDKFISNTKITREYPLPKPGEITFYMLTNNGIYSASAQKSELVNGQNVLSPMFFAANNLVSEFLKTAKR